MKKMFLCVAGMVLGTIILCFPVVSYANSDNLETNAGIQFKKSTISSSDIGSKDPFTPNNPTTKPAGRLPQTGELLQPIILLLLGFLFVIIAVAIYLSTKKENSEEE